MLHYFLMLTERSPPSQRARMVSSLMRQCLKLSTPWLQGSTALLRSLRAGRSNNAIHSSPPDYSQWRQNTAPSFETSKDQQLARWRTAPMSRACTTMHSGNLEKRLAFLWKKNRPVLRFIIGPRRYLRKRFIKRRRTFLHSTQELSFCTEKWWWN